MLKYNVFNEKLIEMIFKNEKIKNDFDTAKTINISLDLLKSGDFSNALISFSNILKFNYSNLAAESGIKSCKYWMARVNKFAGINSSFIKGKTLLDEWLKFENFIKSIKNIQPKVISAVMYYIFNTALDEFKKNKIENKIFDLDTVFYIGLCHKKIGNYSEAVKNLEEAISYENGNSNVMSQLADCYALIDEEKKSKLLFREAFFIDPSSIDVNLLDSNIISYLITTMKEYKIPDKEICHWLPVYGRILGIFNVIRELLPIEAAKLKKEIYALEKNYSFNLDKDNILKAKLINFYFWLYDYIRIYKNDKNEMMELEYKIKNTSEEIFNIFINNTKTGE